MKKFSLLLAAMLLSVMSFAEWQRVTTVAELLEGGTMIIGYEETAKSGVIVPMRTEGKATTSAAGIMYSGTTAGSSTKNTVDMSKLSESTAYEVTVVPSTSVTGAVCIKIGDNFLGNTNTKNNCKLFTTESATTAFTPTVGTNDVFTLKIAANQTYHTLQYNIGSPRFAVYDGNQKNVVIYKKVENTNPLLTCEESVAFGNISSLVGTIPSKTLKVTAKNLTEDIIVTLSDGAAFTLDESEFDVRNGGTIKISPVLTIGENTATLTLTSGEKSVTVTLTATIKQAYTISWVVDNKEYTAGNPTTDVIEGEKVTVLPTAPADNTLSCSNIFVGWSTNNIGSTAGQTQPADLFISTGTAPVVTENTTYHAVFATAEGEAKEYFKETFDQTNGTGGNDGSWSGSIATSKLITDNTGWTFTSESGANKCAKIGANSAQGSATTPTLTGLTGSAVLTFRAGAWKGDATTLNLSISVGKLSEESVTLADASFSTYTINITGATEESKITFKGKQASKARFFLDDVVVKSAVTLKDFRTNCEGVSTAINNAAVETPALKSIENGQLVIIRDGVKYNAMGVRLQ